MNVLPQAHPVLSGSTPFSGLLPALRFLAHGMSNGQMAVEDSEGAGRTRRAVLTTAQLLLINGQMDERPEMPEALFGLLRATVAHAVAHRRFSPPGLSTVTLKPLGLAVVSAIEDARVERLLCCRHPGVRQWFLEQLADVPDPVDLSFDALVSRMDRILLDPHYSDDNHWVNKAKRLFEEVVTMHGLGAYDKFRAVASVLANDLGQMRVRFDPQHYVVPSPYRDDNSYLWTFPDDNQAQDEAVASPRSVAQQMSNPTNCDEATSPQDDREEVELGRFVYPEWHHLLDLWRQNWCTVLEKLPGLSVGGLSQAGVAAPHSFKQMALRRVRRLSRRHRLRRQWEGDDIDLNAAIEVLVDRRLNLQPEPRLFMRAGRETGASSILVLLDLSESTNEACGASGQTLLDLEKQAALILAAATVNTNDRIAIHGFSSNTRAQIDYYRILEFGAPLEGKACSRLASVSARHSTRIGAALRHASALLQDEGNNQPAILLVTDGAPADVDVFDSEYLIEDARVAVMQARMTGVRVFCIAVDAGADHYVRRIFGWRDYCIAENAFSLPTQLQRAYARLVRA